MKANDPQLGPQALVIVEEAFHLLRRTPISAWACYYIGALPFIIALLYFWADMSRSAFAGEHCFSAALGLAAVFIWMKCWQAAFAGSMRGRLSGPQARPWTARRVLRLIAVQAIIQPAGVYLLPLAALVVVPFGWVYAFYQNATALGDDGPEAPWRLAGRCWHQATLWPKQNYVILVTTFLFTLLVCINLLIVIAVLPWLARTLFGLETAFSRLRLGWMNTTTLAVTGCVGYLVVDPLIKAAYVLRCFYGESLQTGEDLKAQLSGFASVRRGAVVASVLAVMFWAAGAPRAEAAEPPAPPPRATPPATLSPRKLDRAIDDVLTRREYAWRMPRESAGAEKGIVRQSLEDATREVEGFFRGLRHYLRRLLRSDSAPGDATGLGLLGSPTFWLILMAAVVVGALIWLITSTMRKRKKALVEAQAEIVQAAPDLSDENVRADQLPEDGWTSLAAEMLARGDLRLALRALYLASLAYLAQRELILLSRYKSNRDYQRELARRGQLQAELAEGFTENVTLFEDAWYGMHEVTPGIIRRFNVNQERIRTHAEA